MKVLITGFPAYSHFQSNCTEILINSFKKDLPAILNEYKENLSFEIINFEKTDPETEKSSTLESVYSLLKKVVPNLCIFLGQSPNSNQIAVEQIAINLFKNEKIIEEAPPAYWSNLPNQEAIPDMLKKVGIPSKLSQYAGTYLCNLTLFSALNFSQVNNLDIKSGFIHIPLTSKQVISLNTNSPFMPFEMIKQAVSKIILIMMKNYC